MKLVILSFALLAALPSMGQQKQPLDINRSLSCFSDAYGVLILVDNSNKAGVKVIYRGSVDNVMECSKSSEAIVCLFPNKYAQIEISQKNVKFSQLREDVDGRVYELYSLWDSDKGVWQCKYSNLGL